MDVASCGLHFMQVQTPWFSSNELHEMGLIGRRRCKASDHAAIYCEKRMLDEIFRLLQMQASGPAYLCLHGCIFIHANVYMGAADARLPISDLPGNYLEETSCRLLPINLHLHVDGIMWPALHASSDALIFK